MLKTVLSRNTSQTARNDAFNCNFSDNSSKSTFRVLSQTVRIDGVNFAAKRFHVHTELQILPLFTDIADIVLDLGPDCYLPNESDYAGNGRITINDLDVKYVRNRFSVTFDPRNPDRSIMHMKRTFQQAHAKYAGDLIIRLPKSLIGGTAVFQLTIDSLVKEPKQGFVFSDDGGGGPGCHFYTMRSNIFSSTRHWLPCAESADHLAVWRFEFVVPAPMVAVACGDLLDTTTTAACGDTPEMKTFLYQLLTPTSAVNVGFVFGELQMYTQPDIPEIVHYALPGLMPLVKHTVATLNRTFTFFEEILACRFPYANYRLVFVDRLPEDIVSFAGLSVLSLHMLYHKRIFDLVQVSRQHLAYAIAQQFFGCFVSPTDFQELWLVKALSRYVNGLFVERFFGQSEHMFEMERMLRAVCDYEFRHGRVILTPSTSSASTASLRGTHATSAADPSTSAADPLTSAHFDPSLPEICSSLYADTAYKKGHFVMVMLQRRLGKDMFLKVLNRILNVSMQFSQVLNKPIDWCHMTVSTDSFFRTITNVTGRELPSFVEQWVHTGGHVRFEVRLDAPELRLDFSGLDLQSNESLCSINQTFNRKQNKLELEIKQPFLSSSGVQNYVGPLTIMIQELDGFFTHTVQVDATVSKHDILCHSKGRKQKKKRVPLSTGEEAEIDLTHMDADSPVMWIRIDPEMLILRQVVLNQQIHQWDYMLRYERDVNAQMQAIVHLRNFPVHQTQNVLMETLENDKFFYKVRQSAAQCLVDVCNRLPDGLMLTASQHPLVAFFQRCYGCKSAPALPAPNNFVVTSAHLQHYFLMLDLPTSIGKIRDQSGAHCPPAVIEFLLSLIRLNDNSSNRYSDDYYRANLIAALGATLGLADHEARTPNQIVEGAREVLAEVVHALNIDTMRPSFGRVVTVNALYVLRNLQRLRHLPADLAIFWKFAANKGVFSQVRRAAMSCIIHSVSNTRNPKLSTDLERLLHEIVLSDKDPYIRLKAAEELRAHPPFIGVLDPAPTLIYPTNTLALAERLWAAIIDPSLECRVRTTLADLYYQMYGRGTPLIVRNPALYDQSQPPPSLGGGTLSALSMDGRPAEIIRFTNTGVASVYSSFGMVH